MSKRYRNGFKRTLCRWTLPTPSTSYRNVRSNGFHPGGNHPHPSPLPATLPCSNNLRHPRLTFSNSNDRSLKSPPNGYSHRRENLLTFSMSKYKFVLGSRTLAATTAAAAAAASGTTTRGGAGREGHGTLPARYARRTSFHYRFSVVEQQERDEEQQQLQLRLQQRKFSMSVIQQPKKQRTKFVFSTAAAASPPTPPNSSISEPKTVSHGNHSKH